MKNKTFFLFLFFLSSLFVSGFFAGDLFAAEDQVIVTQVVLPSPTPSTTTGGTSGETVGERSGGSGFVERFPPLSFWWLNFLNINKTRSIPEEDILMNGKNLSTSSKEVFFLGETHTEAETPQFSAILQPLSSENACLLDAEEQTTTRVFFSEDKTNFFPIISVFVLLLLLVFMIRYALYRALEEEKEF